MLAALAFIPLLVQALGLERFGLLALIWMGVGYFSLFDLGLGKALTHQIATRLANQDQETIPNLIRTGVLALAGLGVLAMLLVAILTPWLVPNVFSVPEDMQKEARWSFWILALSLPAVLASAGLAGTLEGYQRFRTLAFIRVPLGISNFVVPALIAVFTPSLIAITLALVLSRVTALWVLHRVVQRPLTAERQHAQPPRPSKEDLITLLRFGGWITVSHIVGPILVYFDRFFISALIGLTAVTHYVTPYEVLSRMMVLPQAIMAALFPAMAQAIARHSANISSLASGASKAMFLAMLSPALGAALFAEELLSLWLDAAFAKESYVVVQFLAAGILVNVLARVPMTALQSSGRADVAAKVHLLEVIPYLFLLWWAVAAFGIVGAALAWMLRVAVDTLLLWMGAAFLIPELRTQAWAHVGVAFVAGPALLLLAQIESFQYRGMIWVLVAITCLSLLVQSFGRVLLQPGPKPDGDSSG